MPDAAGIGEVIARGPNVMLGYLRKRSARRSPRSSIAGCTRATSDGSTRTAISISSAARRRSSLTPTAKTFTRTRSKTLYKDSPYIKELSVVGLPDGIGEKVACLVVPDYDYDIASRAKRCSAGSKNTSAMFRPRFPSYKRVKVLHFTDDELPRTATRKVKRREVVEMIQSSRSEARRHHRDAATREQQRDADVAARHCRHRLGSPARGSLARLAPERPRFRQPDVRRTGDRHREGGRHYRFARDL